MKTRRADQIKVGDQLQGIAGLTLMVVATAKMHDGLVHFEVRAQRDGMNVNAPGVWKTFKPADRLPMA